MPSAPEEGTDVIFTIIGWLVFGLVVGFIARALVPGRDDIGVLRTIVLGVVGSVIGAVVVLLVYNRVVGRRTGSGTRRPLG